MQPPLPVALSHVASASARRITRQLPNRNPGYFRHAKHTGPSTKDDRLSPRERRSRHKAEKESENKLKVKRRTQAPTPGHSLVSVAVGSLYRSHVPSMLLRTWYVKTC
jgi:hypothetical protein